MMDRSAQMHRARKGVKQETEERDRDGGRGSRHGRTGALLLQRGIGGVPIHPHLWCLPPPHPAQRPSTYSQLTAGYRV